jgi:hypothetical protein
MPSELAAFGEMASHLANPWSSVHWALLRSGILPPVDRRTSGVIVQSPLRYGFWIAVLLIVLGIGYAGYKTYRETQAGIATAERFFFSPTAAPSPLPYPSVPAVTTTASSTFRVPAIDVATGSGHPSQPG